MAGRSPRALAVWQRGAVRRIRATRRATLTLVARLPEEAILRPRTLDRWSVKDVLGHLMSCDEETVRRFRLIAQGQGRRIRWFESMADADRFNARTVAVTRRVGLRPLLRRMAQVHEQFVAGLERLPPAALADPSHAYPVVDWLTAPGWSHEREHMHEVREWWRAQQRAAHPPRRRRARG